MQMEFYKYLMETRGVSSVIYNNMYLIMLKLTITTNKFSPVIETVLN